MSLKQEIVKRLPNIPFLRKTAARMRIKNYANLIPAKEIAAAEADYSLKVNIANKYAEMYKEHAKAVDQKINLILSRVPAYRRREDQDVLRTDMRFCRFAYGFQPDEYLGFALEQKSMEERLTFISDRECLAYAFRMNDIVDYWIYQDKARTYEKFKTYYKREAISVQSVDDYEKFSAYIKKFPVFVKKEVGQACGRGIELVNIPEILEADRLTEKDFFDKIIQSGKLILEERVIQSEAMSTLNPSSVNTVRCATFATRDGYEVVWTFMKIGQGGSFVDNGGAGGILVGIDQKTGVLNSDGIDEFGGKYVVHPDTGVPFCGYQLPDWNEMIALCKKMSAMTPTVKYVGWDMAHTDKGWVVIEGNGAGQMIGPQMVWQTGYKEKVEEVMARMNLVI